VMTETEH